MISTYDRKEMGEQSPEIQLQVYEDLRSVFEQITPFIEATTDFHEKTFLMDYQADIADALVVQGQTLRVSDIPFSWSEHINYLISSWASDPEAMTDGGRASMMRSLMNKNGAPKIRGFNAESGASGGKGTLNFVIESDKYKYLFGEVTSSAHNTSRSKQLKSEMARLGIYNNDTGQSILREHFESTAKKGGM